MTFKKRPWSTTLQTVYGYKLIQAAYIFRYKKKKKSISTGFVSYMYENFANK